MKLRAGRWLSGPQVARACAVDLKTIRNWVKKGKLPALRTVGGHLRFWPLDVVAFLSAYELGVPEALRHLKLAVVVLDVDEDRTVSARRALGKRHEVVTTTHLVDALVAVSTLRPDVLVVGDAGLLDVESLRQRLAGLPATRHVRVVAHPGDAAGLRSAIDALGVS